MRCDVNLHSLPIFCFPRPLSSQAVLAHVKSALAHRGGVLIAQEDVGVVSPYHQQVKKLRRLLEKHGLEGVKARKGRDRKNREQQLPPSSVTRSQR